MPTYQYACTDAACRHEFEQFQAFTDAPLTDCPVCGKRVRKVYGSVGVVFKGSGFYRTDSRDSKAGSTAASSSDSSKSDSATSSTKSDSSSASGKAAPSSSGSGTSGSSTSGSTSSSGAKAAVAG